MSLIYKMGQSGVMQKLTWKEDLRPFFTSQVLSQKSLGLAVVQGVQPPAPLEWLMDLCGQDRLCLGVAGKVLAVSISTPPPSLVWVGCDWRAPLRGQSTQDCC